jgi:hypothetical protein
VNPLFAFDTTHMALWAEEVAREEGIPAEVVPAPPELEALCALALATFTDRVDQLRGALEDAGVEFYPPKTPGTGTAPLEP